MEHITEKIFVKRFVALILGVRNLPKDRLTRNILLISAVLNLTPEKTYTEEEINQKLEWWSKRFGGNFGLDYVTLRRYLVDEGYLQRDPSGEQYELTPSTFPFPFDDSLWELDLKGLISEAKKEQERKKQEYLGKKRT